MDLRSWNAAETPEVMLEYLQGKVSDRKLRLFACACCRRIWHLLVDPRSQQAVEAAERYTEGGIDSLELLCAHYDADEAVARHDYRPEEIAAFFATAPLMFLAEESSGMIPATAAPGAVVETVSDTEAERAWQCRLLHCLFGNPFQPLSLDPALCTPTIVALAQSAFDERILPSGELDPLRLAVLADALEEASASSSLVEHLRGPGPHTWGCFVVDALLGKE